MDHSAMDRLAKGQFWEAVEMTIERLPLFPLDTVLVPGMVLPLHIFEARYRLMMRHVLAGDRRFGVLLQRGGADASAVEPCEVGTVAEVTDVVPLENGLMNISTTGGRRFRVLSFHRDQPYLTADVALLPDEYVPSQRLCELQTEVERLTVQYVTLALALSREQVSQIHLPSDPVALSYKVAGLVVPIHVTEAQDLLAIPTVEHRLYAELLVLRRELTILQHMHDMRHLEGRLSPN